jgi:hypothetical protein
LSPIIESLSELMHSPDSLITHCISTLNESGISFEGTNVLILKKIVNEKIILISISSFLFINSKVIIFFDKAEKRGVKNLLIVD